MSDLDAMAPQELIQAIQDTGMVGLGGATFPSHAKLSVPGHVITKKVDTAGTRPEQVHS